MTDQNNKQNDPIRILTFTPVWRRPEVFEICLAGLKRLQHYDPKRFSIRPFFIVSESEAAIQVERYGFDFIYWQNQPLGAKKNAGLKYAMKNFEFDYLMEIGSDDIVNNEYLDYIEPQMRAGVMQFIPCAVYFIDVLTGKTACWVTDKVLGLGRCIHRNALELFAPDYELWTPEKERGMDTCSWMNLMWKKVFVKILPHTNHFTLDIKSEVNINHLDSFVPVVDTAEQLLSHYPEGDMIMKLIEEKALVKA